MRFRLRSVTEAPQEPSHGANVPPSGGEPDRGLAAMFKLKRFPGGEEAPPPDSATAPHREGIVSPGPLGAQSQVTDPSLLWAQRLVEAVRAWAGEDRKRWGKVLSQLKVTWEPAGWVPDSPRDLLVAWASSNDRLIEAQVALGRLERKGRLTSRQRDTKAARKVDIGFCSRLAEGLRARAIRALKGDLEAAGFLVRLCGWKSSRKQA